MAGESVGVISVAWINFVQAFHGPYSMKKTDLIPAHCMQVAEFDKRVPLNDLRIIRLTVQDEIPKSKAVHRKSSRLYLHYLILSYHKQEKRKSNVFTPYP